ncbi:hypothetical protein ACFL0Z_02680 [Patescibacteria group bacterium]
MQTYKNFIETQENQLQEMIEQLLDGIWEIWPAEKQEKKQLDQCCQRLIQELPRVNRLKPLSLAIPTKMVPLSVQYRGWEGNGLAPAELSRLDRWRNLRRLHAMSFPYFLIDTRDALIEPRWYRGKSYCLNDIASLGRLPMSANEALAWIHCQKEIPKDTDYIALGTKSPWLQVIRLSITQETKIKVSVGDWRNGDRQQRLLSYQTRYMI